MHTNIVPEADLETAALGYLLYGLEVTDTYACSIETALPGATIYVEDRGAVLSVTTAAEPLFRDGIRALATDLKYDVVLVRVAGLDEDFIRTTVDVSLGLLPGAMPWSTNGLEPWVGRNNALWLVSEMFGPAVSVGVDGFTLELVAPYATMAQRTSGVLRAAAQLASLLPTTLSAVW